MKKYGSVFSSNKKNLLNSNIKSFEVLTGDIVNDRLFNLPYCELTKDEEMEFIKKSKLSFYYNVDDQQKEEYLEYYKEMFPDFRVLYDKSNDEDKQALLQMAIKDSLSYRNQFLSNNGRLVFFVAEKYAPFDDLSHLYQEGTIGMLRALEKFDVSLGTRFSTYAMVWIRQSITRYLSNSTSTIRIPVHKREQLYHLIQAEQELSQGGEVPDASELAAFMGISLKSVNELLVIKEMTSPVSLDSVINNSDDAEEYTTLQDFISNDEMLVSEEAEQQLVMEEIRRIIEHTNLNKREKAVIYLRYGFKDNRPWTLAEIGNHFGVTRERVRQIEMKVLKKLRMNASLKSYYQDDFRNTELDDFSYSKKRTL